MTKYHSLPSLALEEVLTILSCHFNAQIQIQSITELSEIERRNLVLRIHIQHPLEKDVKSVILKQTLPDITSNESDQILGRFTRDWKSLEFLTQVQRLAL